MPDAASDAERMVAPPNSNSSTNLNLSRKTQQRDDFEKLEGDTKKYRNSISAMVDQFKNSSSEDQNTILDEDSYTDADDFIINKGGSPTSKKIDKRSIITNKEDHSSWSISKLQATKPSLGKVTVSNRSTSSSNIFGFEKPELTLQSNDIAHMSNISVSSMNRHSMISDYTPSIHEVNQVQYVVDSNKNVELFRGPDATVNSQQFAQYREKIANPVMVSNKPTIINVSKDSVKSMKSSPNEGHSSGNSISSTASKNLETGEHKKKASYDSIVESKSGTLRYIDKDFQFEDSNAENLEIMDGLKNQSQESFAFDVGPLYTEKKVNSPKEADRLDITSLENAIPPRSPNRPVSMLNPQIERADHRFAKSEDLSNLMIALDDEIAKSPKSHQILTDDMNITPTKQFVKTNQEAELLQKQQTFKNATPNRLHLCTRTGSNQSSVSQSNNSPRPLPPPPLPKHESKPSDSKPFSAEDGYVTEDEVDKNGSPIKREKKHKKKSSKDKKKRTTSDFKKGHFNHDTLVQLLKVTEGTIIGQEFQNIGLQPTEKQLLERLVDSLSRLTADMVIDSERHDESVRRLNKAIKALEGF